MNKPKLLKVALIAIGIGCLGLMPLSKIWPGGFLWHGGEGQYYFQMIAAIYAVLGVMLIWASRNPSEHRSLIWFTIWSSIAHGGVMALQAMGDHHETAHLYGDVPMLFAAALVLWLLMPPRVTN